MPTLRQSLTRLFGFGLGAIERPRAFNPQGVSGTAVYAGYPIQRERSPKWVGQQRYITSAELVLNTSIVAAGVHYFLNLIAHPEWSVRPADDKSKEAQDVADLIEKAMHEMQTPWPRVVRRSAMYRFHGFGIQEWWAKKTEKGGDILFGDIEPRPQFTIERWDVDESGAVIGVYQRSPHTGEIIGLPRSKLIYMVDDTISDSPEGVGIFRHLGEPYERLMGFQQLEVRAFERDLRGTPIGRAPLTMINRAISDGTLTRAEGDSIINHLKDFVQTEIKKSDTGVVLDSMIYETQSATGLGLSGTPQWGIDLLSGSAAGLGELGSAIDRLQREMARIIGTENLMMGDAGGNRALAVDKSRNLYLNANAVLTNIGTTYESDFIIPLLDLNGIDHEMKPSFEVEDVSFKDVAEVTNALAAMAKSGAPLSPEDDAINDVRDLLGISQAPPPSPEMMGATPGGVVQPQTGKQPAAATDQQATSTIESTTTAATAGAAKKFRGWLGKANPNQPRVPAGSPEGGQFGSGGGSAGVDPIMARELARRAASGGEGNDQLATWAGSMKPIPVQVLARWKKTLSGEEIVAYHGTSAELLDSIKAEGIHATEQRNFQNKGEAKGSKLYKGDRGESVFVTESPLAARAYARLAGGEPVILELRIPKDEWAKFKYDQSGSTDFGAPSAYAPKLTIPPKWIVQASDEQGKVYDFDFHKADGDVIVYSVITVDAEVTKDFDLFKPGPAEAAWLETATPEEQSAWEARKAQLIEERKQVVVKRFLNGG